MATCDEHLDAYGEVCSELSKLCPRLVPSPLWGLNLATLARMSPQIAVALFGRRGLVVKDVSTFWNTARSGLLGKLCTVCNTQTDSLELDEDWLYCTSWDESGSLRGVAYLRGLRPVCGECHLAKHQGRAGKLGKSSKALEHLAKVNSLDLGRTEELVKRAFEIHSWLSNIAKWTFVIGDIGTSEPLRKDVEDLLNTMYDLRFSVFGEWLEYLGRYIDALEHRCARETLEVLSRISVEQGQAFQELGSRLLLLVGELKRHFGSRGIEVLDRELLFLFERGVNPAVWNALTKLSESSVNQYVLKPMRAMRFLKGFWLVYIPSAKYPDVARDLIRALDSASLTYIVECSWRRKDYERRDKLPLRVHVPSLLAATYVSEVADVVGTTLRSHGIRESLYLIPNMFEDVKTCQLLKQSGYKCYVYVAKQVKAP